MNDNTSIETMANLGFIAMVEKYIDNEKNYIKRYDYENCKKDLLFLENLSYVDIISIKNMVLEDKEIMELINEKIHDKLYEYQKLKRESE